MLKDELDFIKEYVAMEKMRFESDTVFPFNINVNTRVKLTEWLIPPLIMQPLVENAIKHGVLVAKTAAEIVIDIQLINPSTIQIDIINTQANPTKTKPRFGHWQPTRRRTLGHFQRTISQSI